MCNLVFQGAFSLKIILHNYCVLSFISRKHVFARLFESSHGVPALEGPCEVDPLQPWLCAPVGRKWGPLLSDVECCRERVESGQNRNAKKNAENLK
jgi:hypothetical protein